MFSFRTLGALELRSASGDEVTGVVAAQKLVALLTYLAVAQPRGLHRRDTVVGLLWPELTQERARAALRHSAYRLRGLLGSDGLVSRGDEDIGIDPAVVRCDAARFDELLDAGDLASALALYQGDLLPGFFLRSAPEFERWLDAERLRLRQRAATSAGKYAESLAQAGQTDEAAHWARRSLVISPDDEHVLRRTLAVLGSIGDTSGALREYDAYAKRLAEEYDAVPAAETTALSEKLRSQAAERRPALAEQANDIAGEAPVVVPTMSPVITPGTPSSLGSHRTRKLAVRGALGIVLLAAVAFAGNRMRRAVLGSPAAVRTIAVLPFDVRGSTDIDYLRDGMSDLLSIGVDGAAGLRSADPRAILSVVREKGGNTSSEADAQRIARQVGAGLYITGSVVEAGGLITLTAALHDSTGRVQSTARTKTAEKARLFELVDELTRQLLAGADPNSPGLVGLAAQTTTSIPALRAYLEGERELRAGQHAAALDAFRQAVADDSTFALAYYRLSSAGRWTTEYTLAEQAGDKATRYGNSLPPYARRLLAGANAERKGNYAEAESLYIASTRSRAGDVEAWFALGDLYYHYNALRGRSKGDARVPFERALAIDPGDGESRVHLLELAAWEGKINEVDSLLSRLPPGSDFAAKWPIIHALIVGDRAAEAKASADLRSTADRALVRVLSHASNAFPSNLAGAARVTSLLTEPTRSPGWRAYGYNSRSQVELARGRWAAARADLTAMGTLEPAAALEYGAMLSLSPAAPSGQRDLIALRSALASWHAEPTPPSGNSVFGIHDGLHPQLRLYLLGLVSTRLGDSTAALRYADSLIAIRSDSMKMLFAQNLARAVRARVWQLRGKPNEALTELGQPWLDPRTHRSHYSSILSQLADRFLRADLLREAGRSAEAIAAYSAAADYSVEGLAYLPVSHLRRGDVYAQIGDREKAAYHYRKVVELLKDCDTDVLPMRADAERKLSTQGSKP